MPTQKTTLDTNIKTHPSSMPNADDAMERLAADIENHGLDFSRYMLMNSPVSTATYGKLVKPGKVIYVTTARQRPRKQYQNLWNVTANVPSSMLYKFIGGLVNGAVGNERIYTSPSGAHYLIIAIQAKEVQLRIVMPLGAKTEQRFFLDTLKTKGEYTVTLISAEAGVHPGATFKVQLTPDVDAQNGGEHLNFGNAPSPGEVHDVLLNVVESFAEPSSIPSGYPGVTVEQVHTIMILPSAENTH